jgi:hypothetical protein
MALLQVRFLQGQYGFIHTFPRNGITAIVARGLMFLEVRKDAPVVREVDGMRHRVLSDKAKHPSVIDA